jgi:hypothetical protein
MKQTVVISSPTCFGYCVSIIRELQCSWLKLRMSLYVEIVQIVQRQGLALIFHVVRFSLQEPVVRIHANQLPIHTQPCLCTMCTIFTYKDIRNFNHAQCNSLMMDTHYSKHVGEEMTTVCFMF